MDKRRDRQTDVTADNRADRQKYRQAEDRTDRQTEIDRMIRDEEIY